MIQNYDHFGEGRCILFDLDEIMRWEAQMAMQQQGGAMYVCAALMRFAQVMCQVIMLFSCGFATVAGRHLHAALQVLL